MGSYSILIIAILFIVFLGTMVCVIILSANKRSKQKKANELIMNRLNATAHGVLKHTAGLPIAEGVMVDVYYCADKFVFKKDGQEFTVARDKIMNVDVVTGKDAKSQPMQGAVAGAHLFGGTAGAMIGMLSAASTYLAISYVSNDEDKYIMLEITSNGTFATKVKNDFAKTNTAQRSVEL